MTAFLTDAQEPVKKAVFDNPNSKCRELWINGRIIAGVSLEFLEDAAASKEYLATKLPTLNIGAWQPLQIIGDPEAISKAQDHFAGADKMIQIRSIKRREY